MIKRYARSRAKTSNAPVSQTVTVVLERADGIWCDGEADGKRGRFHINRVGDAVSSWGFGRSSGQRDARAVLWFRKGEQEHPTAQTELAWCLFHGSGITKDEAGAVQLYKEAASGRVAQCSLGVVCESGLILPPPPGQSWLLSGPYLRVIVARDPRQAVAWYLKAAKRGYPPAQFHLGRCFSDGVGGPKDPGEAKRWLQKAADRGWEG